MIAKNIFIYHLDNELQRLFKYNNSKEVAEAFEMILKVAILLCEESVIIPASNYLESDIAYKVINKLLDSNSICENLIVLSCSSRNISELLEKKKIEHGHDYRANGYHYVEFEDHENGIYLPGTLVKRERSATKDIREKLTSDIGMRVVEDILKKYRLEKLSTIQSQNQIVDIFDELGNKAIIAKNVIKAIHRPFLNSASMETDMNCLITQEYIRSFIEEYNATCLKDIPIIDANLILPKGEQYEYISYKQYMKILHSIQYGNEDAFSYVKRADYSMLIRFKYSNEWKNAINPISNDTTQNEGARRKIMNNSVINEVTVGIITALPLEYAAVKKIIGTTDIIKDEGIIYETSLVKSSDSGFNRVALIQSGEGNNNSAISAVNMVNLFPNLAIVIVSGIAAGVPDNNDIRLGDVIIGDSIIQYDYQKNRNGELECKAIPDKLGPIVKNALSRMEADRFLDIIHWNDDLTKNAVGLFEKPDVSSDILFDKNGNVKERGKRIDGRPIIYRGCIASGNTVVKNAELRNTLSNDYKAIAIEMEGSGVADTANNCKCEFAVFRGVCDYADEHKNDDWHEYAAICAAAVTIGFIKYLPTLNED